MAFTVSIRDRVSFGNRKLISLDITEVQIAGSTYDTNWNRAEFVTAVNNTDSSDGFKEAIGSQGSQANKSKVTFTSVTADDAGHAVVIGR